MAPGRKELELALAGYWANKDAQRAAAEKIQSTAEGSSKAVRGGGHFEPIVNLIARFFGDAGYPAESIHAQGQATVLPGFFRPTKNWDLVVVHRGVLVAAIELKALGNPSFSNNYNNRLEEALGSSLDLAAANASALVGTEKPWMGYLFVMEDAEMSRKPLRERSSKSFDVEPIWRGRSYQERYAVTGQRLLDERMYDAVCYLVSSPDDPGPREPAEPLDWRHFSAAIQARISYLSDLGYP